MFRTRTTTTPDREQVTMTSPRLDGRSVLTAVRAFYLDIAEWADDDPSRWGPWAVRCPVSASDASHKKDRSHCKSRMDARTRERLPVLPALVSWVAAERTRTAELLAAAEQALPGEPFTSAGVTLRRSVMKTETTGRLWAEDPDTGRRRDLSFEEHRGFWTWAVVEVLRHTGIRIEELTELSHHSLIQYRLPTTGELIPLLQITPSKTDAERLLVISPELADALSTLVARIRGNRPDVPLVVSYDKNERVYNPPLPLLFQWRRRLENRPVSERALRKYLDHALSAIGVKDAAGAVSVDHLFGVNGLVAHGGVDVAVAGDELGDVWWHAVHDRVGDEHASEVVEGVAQGARSSPGAAHCAPARNTARPPTRNGPSSSATSNTAR